MKQLYYYLDYLKENKKKFLISNISISVVILLIGVALAVLVDYMLGAILIFIAFVYLFMCYADLIDKYEKLVESKQIAFNAFYRYIITFIENEAILYEALQMSLEYVDDVLKGDINGLLLEMENDTSLTPFINFSNVFKDEMIKQMVILLYKTQEEGSKSVTLDNMNKAMIELQNNSIDSYIGKEKNGISKYSFIPLALTVVMILVLSMFVMKLIGSGIYV